MMKCNRFIHELASERFMFEPCALIQVSYVMKEDSSVHIIPAISTCLDQNSGASKSSLMRTDTWMRHDKSLLYVIFGIGSILFFYNFECLSVLLETIKAIMHKVIYTNLLINQLINTHTSLCIHFILVLCSYENWSWESINNIQRIGTKPER